MKSQLALIFGSLVFAFSTTGVMAADVDKLAKDCAECHGDKGQGGKEENVPVIAGAHPDFFILAMEDYAAGARPAGKSIKDKNMKDVASKLSGDQIEKLAEYYSKQKYKPVKQSTDAALAAKGEKLHDEYCAKCHEDKGKSNIDGMAILAGQPKGYLLDALKEYVAEKRPTTKKMKKKLDEAYKKAGDDGLKQFAEFYASQQ